MKSQDKTISRPDSVANAGIVICLLVCLTFQNHGVFAARPATPSRVEQLIQDARSPVCDAWMQASQELGTISNDHHELRGTIWDAARVNTLGQRFVFIEPGTFSMGPDRHRSTELAIAHKVTLSKPFFMAATEVTNAEFAVFRENVPASPYSPDPDSPAVNVTWRDAVAFCEFLSEREGVRYRLPTEAEWEYACRAGSTHNWSHGRFRIRLGQYAWYKDAVGRASRVAQLKPNAWGLYDMQGNVMEWVSDWWSHSYYKECASSGIVTDPAGPAFGTSHVLRSGCWLSDNALACSCTARFPLPIFDKKPFTDQKTGFRETVGFRVVREGN